MKKWTTVLVTGLAVLWGSAIAGADDRTMLPEVVRDVEIEVAAVSEHAAKLEQMAEWPNRYTMTSNEFEWTGIRARIDDIGELVPKLQKAADTGKPWQKDVVNEMTSLIKAMEVQAEKGLKQLNETASVERLYANELYELRIQSIIQYANHIDQLVEFIETKYPMMS
jgi:hypothetical protein